MWIDFFVCGVRHLVNTEAICQIKISYCAIDIVLPAGDIKLAFDEREIHVRDAFYQGLILALNGLDFVLDDSYIKPLLRSKNEALHRHLMLKEVLADQK
jgi:hypothetical protein